MPARPSVAEIFLVALRLGCTSFGGPVAHLAYFRDEYVVKRRWLDEAQYADLVALCQFLPGPASSQTGFGVGYLQRGLGGGLAAWLGFTLPSAVLMIGLALGLPALGSFAAMPGVVQGLKIAAVAVVAQAVWAMGRSLCPDWPRRVLALAAAVVLLWLPFAWSQIAVIAAGAMAGRLFPGGAPGDRGNTEELTPGIDSSAIPSLRVSAIYLGLFFALLFALPFLARLTENPVLVITDRFYRAGSLVFGGGHVVLPLLEKEIVAPGWVTRDAFLAGYGAAQALPGPLFTFSGFLGALIHHGPAGAGMGGVGGGVTALLAIFLPAVLLVAGALPFWQRLRHRAGAQAAMRGANAAVVGLLLAALYQPVGTAGIKDASGFLLALGGFVALQVGKVPAWAVVIVIAAMGAWLR